MNHSSTDTGRNGPAPFYCLAPQTSRKARFANWGSIFRIGGLKTNTATGFVTNANNFATDQTQWNFAWALHAGLSYKVTPGFSVELAYRYLNMGNGQSGAIVGFLNNPQNTVFHIDNITSQDFTLGLRWMLQPEAPPPAYPLVRKG